MAIAAQPTLLLLSACVAVATCGLLVAFYSNQRLAGAAIDAFAPEPKPSSTSNSTSDGSNNTTPSNPTPVVIAIGDTFDRLDAATGGLWETLDLYILEPLWAFSIDWDAIDMEQLAGTIMSALPRFLHAKGAGATAPFNETPQSLLLAQAEAIVHKPIGFASSPSLPGTVASPWWTDFAHLIYWFYFVATFTTVVFLWYLYDLKVRRVETAHPIRETRGFSRAQTGDLVTAVLPLTWSATMVMHASTHSINFDENTAGTVFSLTVIAYQWGWNYYFPRDIIAQFETAPRVVGRGRIVSFEATPVETLASAQLDSWALRATIGSRHGSRGGRLNTSPALSLVLPTDISAGSFAALASSTPSQAWRKALSTFLADAGTAPYVPESASETQVPSISSLLGLDTPTLFRSKPSVYVSGARLTLVYNHFAPLAAFSNVKELSWVTCNFFPKTEASAQSRSARDLFGAVSPIALPTIENLAGAFKGPLTSVAPACVDLSFSRQPRTPSTQHLIWTGPDAVTGAGATALMSTEEHGWTSPVAAREAGLRAALALKASIGGDLKAWSLGSAQTALLLPFDVNARSLLQHNTPAAGLPFSWALASAALESEIDTASTDLWVHALAPEMAVKTLGASAPLAVSQFTTFSLRNCPRYSAGRSGVASFLLDALAPIGPAESSLGRRSVSALTTYAARVSAHLPLVFGAQYPKAVDVSASRARPRPTFAPSFVVTLSPHNVRYGAGVRAMFAPSALGFGLDETRLVRTGTSRLADTALIANKLESLGGPSLTLPGTPVSLLSLGWSTTASLSAYPSYKLSRGGVFRRPFTGLANTPRPLEGVKDSLTPLLFAKNSSHLGLPSFLLSHPSIPPFKATAPSLDTQTGAWASVWAVLTPAPTEDLDPTFINANWTPETNTTRRSDHNSRYLVSWSPLLSPLAGSGALNPSLSGPGARAAYPTTSLRTSPLALNELGLKNSFGRRGSRHYLLASFLFSTDTTALVPAMGPSTSITPATTAPSWAALWGAFPAVSTNPFANVATQGSAVTLSGRSARLLTTRAVLARAGANTPLAMTLGGGDRFNALTDALARLEYARSPFEDAKVNSMQGYIPVNSAISVSRRLRVTKGVTLPSDTPMHVICGSKDVIHSWAIPGLNVKIDCVPGYNSHRRLLLRWRGAYWGQCMEVCGRYHHWMPIMINVVHPALFIDWCLTFLRGLDAQTRNGPATLPAGELEQLLRMLAS